MKRSFHSCKGGFSLVEVMIASAILVIALGTILYSFTQSAQIAKYQSVYETSLSYAEQALEYSLSVPYSSFSQTNTASTVYCFPFPTNSTTGYLYSTESFTNCIPTTTYAGAPITVTNVTLLATQNDLPLDDLGSYVTSRSVLVNRPSGADTNLNYVLITVSNAWTFLGRVQTPIILKTIRY
jgi:prepilin-type N-terminal cleavage/methylation domain-containing protein